MPVIRTFLNPATAHLPKEVRAGLLPVHRVEVVTVRNPDEANQHTVFVDGQRCDTGVADHVRVVVVDVDLDKAGISEPWIVGAATSKEDLSPAAAAHAQEVVVKYLDDRDVAGS